MLTLIKKIITIISIIYNLLGGKKYFYIEPIYNIYSAQKIIWLTEQDVIIVDKYDIYKYNIYTEEKIFLAKNDNDYFVGITSTEQLEYCSYTNRRISSLEEYSTTIDIYDDTNTLLHSYDYFETILPIYFRDNIIIAKTSVDFLEQHYYKIDIDTGEKEEYYPNMVNKKYSVKKDIKVKVIFPLNEDIYFIEDIFGNLYLYRKIYITPLFSFKTSSNTL